MVVTLGKGKKMGKTTAVSYVRDADNEYIIEPPRNDQSADVDTTGAGDAFAAGFIYGLVKGKGLEECGRLGDFIAKLCISRTGARHGLPTEEELALRYGSL